MVRWCVVVWLWCSQSCETYFADCHVGWLAFCLPMDGVIGGCMATHEEDFIFWLVAKNFAHASFQPQALRWHEARKNSWWAKFLAMYFSDLKCRGWLVWCACLLLGTCVPLCLGMVPLLCWLLCVGAKMPCFDFHLDQLWPNSSTWHVVCSSPLCSTCRRLDNSQMS